MAWKPPAAPKCHACEKSVYHVEQVIGPGGLVYHDTCFKCSTCSKRLVSTNLAENDKKIFCKECYGKHFGPKGYGFAGGSSFLTTGIYNELTLIEKPALSNSSSIVSSPNSFPNTPDTNSTSIESQPVPPFPPRSLRNYPSVEQEVSTFKSDSPMTTFPRPRPRSLFATPSPRRFHIEQEKCLRCKKSVYAAEQVIAAGGKFHQSCFRCLLCSKSLVSTNLTEHNSEFYCNVCYGREFGPKGYGFANGAAFLTNYSAV